MTGLAVWQDLLRGLGWVLTRLYDIVPSYAVAIIVLTIFIRLLLLPLGIKQIRSMHAMSALAPKVKAIQTKYKGNRSKQQEEIQKLYQEHGVNPLGGCLPMVLQIPVLIALYSVLRFPANVGAHPADMKPPLPQSHIEVGSNLYDAIIRQRGDVRWLLCSAGQAGTGKQPLTSTSGSKTSQLVVGQGENAESIKNLDCDKGIPVRIPYYVLALFMVATTYYQSRQMQRASPATSQQQQTLTRIMPLLFGVWGFLFPAGLVVYWTTSNLWQIGQQHFVIRARERDEAAIAEGRKPAPGPKRRGGLMSNMMQRAQQDREHRGGSTGAGERPARGRQTGAGRPSSGRSSAGRTGSEKAAPDPSRPRSYRPSATSSSDGGGRTAPKGTRSPLGVAGEDGNVHPEPPGTGTGASGKGSQGSGQPARSGQRSQGGQRSGSRGSAGSRKKRRKR